MPAWLQEIVDKLNLEPEPEDIIETEIRFLRLCRNPCAYRQIGFRDAYGNTVQQAIDIAEKCMPLMRLGNLQMNDDFIVRWRNDIEIGFYDQLAAMEMEWASEFNWIEALVNRVGLDPFERHWGEQLSRRSYGFRRSLRRIIEEYADVWIRRQLKV